MQGNSEGESKQQRATFFSEDNELESNELASGAISANAACSTLTTASRRRRSCQSRSTAWDGLLKARWMVHGVKTGEPQRERNVSRATMPFATIVAGRRVSARSVVEFRVEGPSNVARAWKSKAHVRSDYSPGTAGCGKSGYGARSASTSRADLAARCGCATCSFDEKSQIVYLFISLYGARSQLDTFDMKPSGRMRFGGNLSRLLPECPVCRFVNTCRAFRR